MRDYIYNKYLTVFLVIQVLFTGFISRFPATVEQWYSRGMYPLISGFLRRLLGWVPFSVGDILYLITLFIILRWLRLLLRVRFSPVKEHLYRALGFVSVVFFFFHLLWGMNYYRMGLPERLSLTQIPYDSTRLYRTCTRHIEKLNELHREIIPDDSLPVSSKPQSFRHIKRTTYAIMKDLHYKGENFHLRHPSAKKSVFSLPLSYMGFSGYINPFTAEAQINAKILPVEMPFVFAHELSHQYGYAAEGEANLLAYIACMTSGKPYFQYAAELTAVQYLLHAVYQSDKRKYEKMKRKLLPGIQSDIQLLRDFWDSYASPVEPVFHTVYDWYLKANRQQAGIHSYSEFVAYLIQLNI